jgi:hypothetical protein
MSLTDGHSAVNRSEINRLNNQRLYKQASVIYLTIIDFMAEFVVIPDVVTRLMLLRPLAGL